MNYPVREDFETTLAQICLNEYQRNPKREFLRFQNIAWSVDEVLSRAVDYAAELKNAGVQPKDQIAVMLNNHPDHVAVILALGFIGAIWVPLDRRFTASNVKRVLEQLEIHCAIAETNFSNILSRGGFNGVCVTPSALQSRHYSTGSSIREWLENNLSCHQFTPDDTRALLFTSGTTGLPKGVVVTERMFAAAAHFCRYASSADSEDIFYLWEPLNHIGGAQIIPMALLSGCRVFMSEKFSASRFWSEVREASATRLHYLGGILELLLRQPATEADHIHQVTLGFGAGATSKVSQEFTQRFGIPLREVYGMTESSSFTSINFCGPPESIGKPIVHFDVLIVGPEGQPVPIGATGEIQLSSPDTKLVTPYYYRNEEATGEAFRHGYFCTGDLGFQDENGYLYFGGRLKEVIRSKGENISPWEVEMVFRQHPAILEVAVVGVGSSATEQEIAAFIRLAPLNTTEKNSVKKQIKTLLTNELASFQRPGYIIETTNFPKTPSERIEKHKLDTSDGVLRTAWNPGD